MSARALSNGVGTCRNCGAAAPDAYCSSCGQETNVRLPTLRQFMREAAGHIVAFDARLWRTLAALVARPGFLTREYFDGRRQRYVRPGRLLLAMSLILFAVLRFTTSPVQFIGVEGPANLAAPDADASSAASADRGPMSPRSSIITVKPTRESAQGVASLDEEPVLAMFGDTFRFGLDRDMNIYVKGSDNRITGELKSRLDRFNHLSNDEQGEQVLAGMLRYGPYAMFLLLPAFAWLQQISYVGRAARYPGRPRRYIEHLVYAAHLHTFLFLAASAALVVPWRPVRWLILAWVVVYILRAKHVIYSGSRLGGLLRGMFVAFAYTLLLAVATFSLIIPAVLVR